MSEQVAMAPDLPGAMVSWVEGDAGRAVIGGDAWTVLRTAGQIARCMKWAGVPRDAPHRVVMAHLNLAGYWPTRAALRTYMASDP